MKEKELLQQLEVLAEHEALEKQRKMEILHSKYGDFIALLNTSPIQQFLKLIEEEIEDTYIKGKNSLIDVPDDTLIKEKYFILGMKQAVELVKDLCNPVHYNQADKS